MGIANVGAIACAALLICLSVCAGDKMPKTKVGVSDVANASIGVHNLPFDLLSIATSRKVDDVVKSITVGRDVLGNTITVAVLDAGVLMNIASAIA